MTGIALPRIIRIGGGALGAFSHVPHALSNAMLLPAATAFPAPSTRVRSTDCARAIGLAREGEGDQSAVARLLGDLYRACYA